MKKLTLLLIAMMALTGCPGKKGSSSDYLPNQGYINGCVNCQFSAAAFAQPVSATLPQGTLTLQIAGDSTQMNLWAYQGQNPLFTYQGQISVAGTLMLNSNLTFGMCALPPGQYQVRALQAGLYSVGTFQVPALEVVGPTRAVLTLTEGVILTNGNGAITSFSAMLFGQQGPSMMNMGMGLAGGYMGAMSGCMDSVGVRF